MTSINFCFRPSIRQGVHCGNLFIRVIHSRRSTSITTSYRIYPSEWDDRNHSLVISTENSNRVNYLTSVERSMQENLCRLEQCIRYLSTRGKYSVEDIVTNFRSDQCGNRLLLFTEGLAMRLEELGQERTARAYRSAVRALIRFNGEDICMEHIDSMFISSFEKHLKERGLYMNTISFYMRNLRAIYNKAIKERRIPQSQENLFEGVYTGIYRTRKRALSKEEINQMNNLSFTLSGNQRNSTNESVGSGMGDALSLFMFSFHARGMSFVDIAYLRKENIKGDIISYFRRKTGQLLEVKITKPMQEIINRFSQRCINSPFVFPIICLGKNERLQYETGLRMQNERLKKLARLAGIKKNISTHVARHSWATIAKHERLPIPVISEGLGHSSEKTTYIYLASFDRSIMDEVSEKISRLIKKTI